MPGGDIYFAPRRVNRSAALAEIVAEALAEHRKQKEAQRMAEAQAQEAYVKNLVGSTQDSAEFGALTPAEQEMIRARGYRFPERPKDAFERQRYQQAGADLPTLPQGARQQGAYQLGYGAAMPSDTVQLTNAQDVFGNKGQWAPEVVQRQEIAGDMREGAEAYQKRLQQDVQFQQEFKEKVRQFGLVQAIEWAKANAQIARDTAATAKTNEETTNERLKRDATSPLSPGFKPTPDADPKTQRNERVLDSVSDLKKRVGGATVGAGSLLGVLPGTPARDFRADLDTLKANIAFGELQAMRDASKTGGALGQVAIREIELLESSLGALDQEQSPANLMKNLNKIERALQQWEAAKQKYGAPQATSVIRYDESGKRIQ